MVGWLASTTGGEFTSDRLDNHSLLGLALSRLINNSSFSPLNEKTVLVPLAWLSCSVFGLLSLQLSGCLCLWKQRSSSYFRPIHPGIFVSLWILVAVLPTSLVIFASEREDKSSFVERIHGLSNRAFSLARTLSFELQPVVNDTVYGILDDLHNHLLREAHVITENFLQQTNLNQPLALLDSMSTTIEELLDAHTVLNKRGTRIALELGKLDSSIRANGEMLSNEIQRTRTECGDSSSAIPSLKSLADVVSQLSSGLSGRKPETFFHLFQMESSMGLFNMLSVLPFNISEVTDQLKSSARVKKNLELSIRESVNSRFSQVSAQLPTLIEAFSAGIETLMTEINRTEGSLDSTLNETEETWNLVAGVWKAVYILLFGIPILPLTWLVCLQSRWKRKRPIQTRPIDLASSGYFSISTQSEDSGQTVELISLNRMSRLVTGSRNTVNPSYETDSLFERMENQETGSVRSSINRGEDKTGDGRIRKPIKWIYLIKGPKQSRRRNCLYGSFCCGLSFLALLCVILVFAVTYVHFHVCLPLEANSDGQRQLDMELAFLLERNSKKWENSALSLFQSYSPNLGGNFSLENHLQIRFQPTIISTLLHHCLGLSMNDSFFKAISLEAVLNFSGFSNIPAFAEKSAEMKKNFVAQSLAIMNENLEAGLLPPDFEYLLEILVTNMSTNSSGNDTSSAAGTTLDTVDKFWSQAITGAVKRQEAVASSLTALQKNRQLMRQMQKLLESLQKELESTGNISETCATRLSQSIRISNYGLQVIRSTRKSFKFKGALETLLKAADTLLEISRRPSFSKSLLNFAVTAYNMGLPKRASNASKERLLKSVNSTIEGEYNRMLSGLEHIHLARSINSRLGEALNRWTAPCYRLGNLAVDAVSTVCPILPSKSTKRQFVPILRKIAIVALLLALQVALYYLIFTLQVCLVGKGTRAELIRNPPPPSDL